MQRDAPIVNDFQSGLSKIQDDWLGYVRFFVDWSAGPWVSLVGWSADEKPHDV